jgi:ribosomal protein L11 methyltransferase
MSFLNCKLAPRILLYAADLTPPAAPEGWIVLPQLSQGLEESAVFGDGSHPTTRLCAGAVDLLCRQRRPQAVLDVGTGTGVLARIARARGASFVVGTDIDPHALAFAKTLCDLDRHPVEIHLSEAPPDAWGARFDLIVANILEGPLRDLASSLAGALAPGGVLLLSGFTRLQMPGLRAHYENAQLTFIREAYMDEWALLLYGGTHGTSNSRCYPDAEL